jgi:hypothetical protein
VASGATAPGPTLEGAPRLRPKFVLMSLSSIPIEIPILWARAVMFGPMPRVLLTPPLHGMYYKIFCRFLQIHILFSYPVNTVEDFLTFDDQLQVSDLRG